MNDTSTADEIGIRGASGGGNLVYTNMQKIYFLGSGVLNKPIGDFTSSPYGNPVVGFQSIQTITNRPYFGHLGVDMHIYSHVIPEPAEYALVFGLFALAFVIVRRCFVRRA